MTESDRPAMTMREIREALGHVQPNVPVATMTTPAVELRQAAEKLRREAASAHRASPSPWAVTAEHVVRCADGMVVADRSGTDHPAERADLPYIALMHPGVGLALADWLDAADATAPHALGMARQILGEQGPKGLNTGHACDNCDGIDPDTCLTNSDRPAPAATEETTR